MKRHTLAIKILYSGSLLLALGCSSAKPNPVQRTQTGTTGNGTAVPATDSSTNTADASAPAVEDKTPAATPTPTPTPAPTVPAVLTITSTAYANNGPIPLAQASANKGGMNQSPPLQWKNPPAGTAFFAIQMLDLDAGNPPILHWMISNIPATSTQLPAAIPGGNNLAAPAEAMGATQMKDYGGPSPPNAHRYELTIYAIKTGVTLNLVANNSTANKTELEGKSLSKATIVGIFTP